MEVTGKAAIVGVQAGRNVVHAEDDGFGIGAPLDHPTDERRNGQTPLGVHRIQRAPVEEVFKIHLLIRPRSRGPSPFTDTHPCAPAWLNLPKEVPLNFTSQWITDEPLGWKGFSCPVWGFHAIRWNPLVHSWFVPGKVLGLFLDNKPVDKFV